MYLEIFQKNRDFWQNFQKGRNFTLFLKNLEIHQLFCCDKYFLFESAPLNTYISAKKFAIFNKKKITFVKKLIFFNIVVATEDIAVDQQKFNRGFFMYRSNIFSQLKSLNQKNENSIHPIARVYWDK